jgi:glycosyltransferase involved in cell wall biosynthesis
MNLSELITIVVPCKDEEEYIGHLLAHLREQKGMDNVRIIIADKSTDKTRYMIEISRQMFDMKIEVIEGGPVSVAKNNGAALVTTPYILFIDADVRFFSDTVILDSVMTMQEKNLDLLGLKGRCYDEHIRSQIAFSIFNVINSILSRFVPFAVGAFFLTKRSRFEELGGFPCKYPTSEDFFLSRQYDRKKFRISKHYYGQDSRRFKKMGYFGMTIYLIKNFLNRNNEKHWNNMDESKYWS